MAKGEWVFMSDEFKNQRDDNAITSDFPAVYKDGWDGGMGASQSFLKREFEAFDIQRDMLEEKLKIALDMLHNIKHHADDDLKKYHDGVKKIDQGLYDSNLLIGRALNRIEQVKGSPKHRCLSCLKLQISPQERCDCRGEWQSKRGFMYHEKCILIRDLARRMLDKFHNIRKYSLGSKADTCDEAIADYKKTFPNGDEINV